MKQKLLFALAGLVLCGGNAWADDVDLSSLTNLNFDTEASWTSSDVGISSSANNSTIEGWTATTGGWSSSAAFSYGGGKKLNGSTAPTAGPNGETNGGAFGMTVAWTGSASYKTTNTINLPAGYYTLTYYAYNVNSSGTRFGSLVGVVSASASYLSHKSSFAANTWVKDEVKFYLSSATDVNIQVGGQAFDATSTSHARLFIDGISLTKDADPGYDITDYFIRNADFEGAYTIAESPRTDGSNKRHIYGPNGWTTVRTSGDQNDMSVLNSNDQQYSGTFTGNYVDNTADTEGNTYRVRIRFGASTTFTLKQTIKDLPAGNYRLMATTTATSADGKGAYQRIYAGESYSDIVTYSSAKNDALWYPNYIDFTINEAKDIEIGYAIGRTTAFEQMGGVDNFKLYRFADDLASATNSLPAKVALGDWSHEGGNASVNSTGLYSTDYCGSAAEAWSASSFAQGTNMIYQTLNEMPEGIYQLSAVATTRYTGTGNNENNLAENVVLFAGSDETSISGQTFTKATLGFNYAGGDLQIGLKTSSSKDAYANWVTLGPTTLLYYGSTLSYWKPLFDAAVETATSDLSSSTYENISGTERTTLTTKKSVTPSTGAEYETAYNELTEAISNFEAAKTNYDALVAEVEKATALGVDASSYAATSESTAATALTSCQNLKVAEYTYVYDNYSHGVSLGEWTKNNITTRRGQHWDGTTNENSGTEYYEMNSGWGDTSWTMSMNQDLTLPAGNYVLKAAGRQASGNCQLSLVVKKGDDVISTVADFPKGDTGLGINTSGATDFTTGEGHTYANGGAGRGFEWRYVKFTLDADATVNVAVNGEGHEIHQWVSFCNATVQTDNEANISLIAYNISLASANTTINNTDYANVTGSEKTALQAAIAADGTLDKTDADAIDAAKTALDNAVTAFTAAKSAYDTFVAAKAVVYEDNLPYASSTKFAAIATAQGATATSADDATSKTNAILSAYRLYVESNALAEGVTGVEQITIDDPNMEVEYDSENHKFGAWQVIGQTDGTINLFDTQSFTDGDGNSNYKYADIWKSDNNAGIQQTVNLAPGKYLLTVTARAQATDGATFGLFAGSARTEINRIGNTGGVFDRGWNDVSVEFTLAETSDVNIGVQSGNGKDLWWSATRFRLVKIGDAVTPLTISDAGWATLYAPYALDFSTLSSNFTAYTATLDESTVTLTPVSDVPANTGVVLKGTAGSYNIPWAASSETVQGSLTGNASAATAYDGVTGYDLYMLAINGENEAQFTKVTSGTIAAGKAYLPVAQGSGVKAFNVVFNDTATAVNEVSSKAAAEDAVIYNLAGQRMNKVQKGINIINGKKFIVK